MATATQTIQEEVTQLERELSTLKGRLAEEERTLQSLNSEAEAMMAGTKAGAKEPDRGLAGRITEIQTRISGLRSAISSKQAEYDRIFPTLRQQQADAAEAATQAELAAAVKQGSQSTTELTAAITECIEKLNAYCAARRVLGRFVDAGRMANLQPAQPDDARRAVEAGTALAAMKAEIWDDAKLRVVRAKLRAGWIQMDDPTIEIHEMRPPGK